MKLKLTLFLLLFSSLSLLAQRTANIGISTGVVNYIGDLGNEQSFPYSSASTGAAITIRDFLNNPMKSKTKFAIFDMQLRLSWHRLQYDEVNSLHGKEGVELRNYNRGLGFRNDLFGGEIDFTYNIYPNLYVPLNKQKWNIFFSAGFGIFYGAPKADLFNGLPSPENRYYFWNDGTIRDAAENSKGVGNVIKKDGDYETNLRDWHTEGQGYNREVQQTKLYSNFNVGFPLGGGVRYFINKLWTISAEVNYYFFLTDYLDDVSSRYATFEELNASFTDPKSFEMARYISDPTGKGTNGVILNASRRGNPDINDSFSYISIEAAYKINWKSKGIYGQ